MKKQLSLFAGLMSIICIFLSINYLAAAVSNIISGESFIQSLIFGLANFFLAFLMVIILVIGSKDSLFEQK